MCSCDYNHQDEPDPQDNAEQEAMYAGMTDAHERFGDHAHLYWTTHRCSNCSSELTAPKFAALTKDKTAVVCLECKTLLAQADFFSRFVLGGLAA